MWFDPRQGRTAQSKEDDVVENGYSAAAFTYVHPGLNLKSSSVFVYNQGLLTTASKLARWHIHYHQRDGLGVIISETEKANQERES